MHSCLKKLEDISPFCGATDSGFKVRTVLLPAATKLWPRLCFFHVSVILFTGGVSGEPPLPRDQADTTPLPGRENPSRTKENPPRPGRPPPGTKDNPPDRADPPRDQGEPPRTRQTPPGTKETPRTRQTPPPGKKTAAYGQLAAGTHPAGMHSCLHDAPLVRQLPTSWQPSHCLPCTCEQTLDKSR